MCMYCTYTLHIMCIYCVYTIHILYSTIYTIHVLYIHCAYTVHILYIYCIYTVNIVVIYFACGRIHSMKIDISSNERVEDFKYLGTTLTNQTSIQEEMKSRLKSGNACYYSMQNLLSSRLLSKNLKTKIYRTIILPVVLYGRETWSLTLSEERRLSEFENRVLRRIFGPK